MISTGFQIFTSTQPVLCFCVFAGKNAVYLANQSCKDGKSKALCHNQKQTIQEFGTAEFLSFGTRQLHKLRVFRCQNEALWHKPKLCATNPSSVLQPKANYPRIRHSRITLLCLCREKRCLFGKSKLQRRQKQSSVLQPKANYPRIRHQPNS